MARKIFFQVLSDIKLTMPRWAIARDKAIPAECAVAQSIATKNKLAAYAVRRDGRQFVATVGTRCKGGGITPRGTVYFTIFRIQESGDGDDK